MTDLLNLTLPARAENVIVVRQAVAGLGEGLGLPEERIDDLKTVVTEACNNVIVHAYEDGPGPLEISARSDPEGLAVTIADSGRGFRPRASEGESSLGLGLPLIASLSDSFEIRGGAGEGSSTSARFALTAAGSDGDDEQRPTAEKADEELALALAPGVAVRPVLARVIGALAARAAFSVERLSDTILLGDAVSAHPPEDFRDGRIAISIKDGDGRLDVRVGPLNEGGGERVLSEMDIPGDRGSLRELAGPMQVERGETADGRAAEFLLFEVST